MQHLWEALISALDQGPVVLATVVWTQGSVPREPGAKLLVDAQGRQMGTIGGGAGEHKVYQMALQVLRTGTACPVDIDLTGSVPAPFPQSSEGICGGRMTIWLCRWSGEGAVALANMILRCCDPDTARSSWIPQVLVLPLDATRPYLRSALPEDPAIQLSDTCYQERLHPHPLLWIVGAGHVGEAVAQVASLAGFRVMVSDDRPDWATPVRFPRARVMVGSVASVREELGSDFLRQHPLYVTLLTRGYTQDLEALEQILPLSPHYLGMIGSHRRIQTITRQISIDEYLRTLIENQRIYAPIGLDIGALTPEEIAVSIVAELIQHRRGGQGGSLSAPRSVAG